MKKKILILTIFGIITVATVGFQIYHAKAASPQPLQTTQANLRLTIADLKKYDGTDPNLPIYLAYEGNIYNVTAGKSFYQPGGTYHWLTGKDATSDLHIAGGDIIKRKYPIVGKIVE